MPLNVFHILLKLLILLPQLFQCLQEMLNQGDVTAASSGLTFARSERTQHAQYGEQASLPADLTALAAGPRPLLQKLACHQHLCKGVMSLSALEVEAHQTQICTIKPPLLPTPAVLSTSVVHF